MLWLHVDVGSIGTNAVLNVHPCRELAKDTERSVGYAFNKVTTVSQFGAAALIARQIYLLCSMTVSLVCDNGLEEFHEDNIEGLPGNVVSRQGANMSCIISEVLPTYGPGLVILLGLVLVSKVRKASAACVT